VQVTDECRPSTLVGFNHDLIVCPVALAAPSVCGDGQCTGLENCDSCRTDCDVCPECVDFDGDGYVTPYFEGASCGPDVDCNDDSFDVNPGQQSSFSAPIGDSFDYDCDEVETAQHTTTFIACLKNGVYCRGDGWLGQAPECGESGTWVRCLYQGGSCQKFVTSNTQACR
jgi:hypothetical protein